MQFDLKPQEQTIPRDPSPEPERTRERERDRERDRERGKRRNDHDDDDYDDDDNERTGGDGDRDRDPRRNHHDHQHRRRKTGHDSHASKEPGRTRKRHDRDESPASDAASDTTVELPPRFDEQGRRRPEDPLADKLESVLMGLFR